MCQRIEPMKFILTANQPIGYSSIYIDAIQDELLMHTQTVAAHPPIFIRLLAHDLRWQLVSALTHSDRRAQELVALLGQPANLVSYHLNKLRQAKLVRNRQSAADHRAIYYSLDLLKVQSLF